MSAGICDECLHMVFESGICRCTEGKIIGCMYIGLAEGCTYYDISTKKRCKNRVVETENGKMYMCIEHGSKKKVHIKTTESKSKKTTSKSETKEKSETQTEKKRMPKKKVEKEEIKVEPKKKPVKRKIVKKIKEDE
jgi:hypothetical protein